MVKTRLAASIGGPAAASLAESFLADTIAMVRECSCALPVVATTEPIPKVTLPQWPQGKGDLGARLETILCRALTQAPAAIALGADSPDLPARMLDFAIQRLATSDAVLGPSSDGGYYLIGLRRCPPGLLNGLPWSSAHTCQATADRLRERGLLLHLLSPWHDVDDLDDLRALHLRTGGGPASATRDTISQLSLWSGSR